MQQMIYKGYAVVVPDIQLNPSYHLKWHLSCHAVIDTRKPRKVWVVLDCVAKVAGKSLDKLLYLFLDNKSDLVGILLLSRREPVDVSVDVKEMFMEVKVSKPDSRTLRFFGDKT